MTPTLEAIRARCDEVGDCWLWRDGTNSSGHPSARFGCKAWLVARFVYLELLGKTLFAGNVVSARCRQRRCVSPLCMVQRSRSQCTARTYVDGTRDVTREHFTRRAAALRQGLAKLTLSQAREIRARRADGERALDLAREFGVCRGAVDNVVSGRSWREPAAPSVFDLAWLEAA
jgi:hypothetical protein